jgi:hypothetical protein
MKLTKTKEIVFVGEERTLYLWTHGNNGGNLTILCKDVNFSQINASDITCVRSKKDLSLGQ